MSLNKEMIFGLLSFGGDNMKWPIVGHSIIEQNVSKNSTYTLDKNVLLRFFGDDTRPAANPSVKIEFPNGQVIEDNKTCFSFAGFLLFCPAGTKLTNASTASSYAPKIEYYDIRGYVDYNP